MKSRFFKKVKAFSLAEVLVGLAITGGILISIMSVALSAYRQVQDNELGDSANNIMLLSIEYFKTPISDVTLEPAKTLDNIAVDETKTFKIASLGDDPANFAMIYVNNDPAELQSCDTNNNYTVFFKDPVNKFVLCSKLVIRRTAIGYYFTSYVAYKTSHNELRTSKLIGFRQKI